MNTLRMGLVMMAVAVGSVCASENKTKKDKISTNRYVETIKKGERVLFDHDHTIVAVLIAEKLFHENEDFAKALLESVGSVRDKNNEENKDEQWEDFSINLPLNYGIRKGTRYLNAQGINLAVVGNKCDIVPKDWANTRAVVNAATKGVAEQVTRPQVITEAIKFGIAYYAAGRK